MTRKLSALLLAAALMVAPVLAAEFSETQRDEIGEIVRDYLLKNPEVLREVMQELERKDQEAEKVARTEALKDNAADLFHAEGDLVAGNPAGKITMVEFFDYNCGYCKKSMPDVLKLIEGDKDLRLVMKEFPILGPGSLYAARAALASREQGKYWDFHLALLGHEGRLDEAAVDSIAAGVGLDVVRLKKDMEGPAVKEVIDRNAKLAEALVIQGTPAFIVDETVIPGAVGYDGLIAAVTEVRDAGGCKIC